MTLALTRTMPPSTKSIEQALTQATERFALELAVPQGQAPLWSEFEWQMARAAAVLQGVTPLLASALRWSGPPQWEAFVIQQRHQTVLRHQRIVAILKDLGARAASVGVPMVMLKGSALHCLGVYSPGERPMADIDLLVRPGDVERSKEVLAAADFVQVGATWKDQIFVPACAVDTGVQTCPPLGENVAQPVKIELHTRIAERLPVNEADITALAFPEEPKPGLNRYSSTRVLLLHLLLHAAGNMSRRSIRLIHLHDISRLATTMNSEQWQELLNLGPAPHSFWWAYPPLQLLNRYQPGFIPSRILEQLHRGCPSSLRRRSQHASFSQLSFASLALQALPARRWCGSWGERLRYIRDRVLPSRDVLASRAVWTNEQWARQDPWLHQPHWRRMARWLFGRPPRRDTMYIVNAVLNDPGP